MIDRVSNFARLCQRSIAFVLACLTTTASAQSPQFGGKNRDFITQRASVSAQWPGGKPTQLWSRDLGDGYSGIAVEKGRLFTMYRKGGDEFVVALDAETGETIWEFKYASPIPEGVVDQFGNGPNATPLVDRTRVFTLGAYGHVHCLRKSDGKFLWSEQAADRLGARPAGFAYSASPIMYKDRILILLGSEGGEVASGILCYHYRTGTLLWARQNYAPIYASPIIINVAGQDQLVVVEPTSVVGLNPLSGQPYWEYPFQNEQKTNCAMPVWDSRSRTLFVSSAYGKGSVGLRLKRNAAGDTGVEELWSNKKIQVHHGATVLVDGYVYASSGSFGPAFVSAINLQTGKIAFRQRGFAKANIIYGDGKLILLDEDGKLAIASASPDGFSPTAQAQILEKTAWTAPTLVGNRLYLRDRKKIIALDVGPPPPPERRGGRKTNKKEHS
jgi:outer membrane protein assembly factor BamB